MSDCPICGERMYVDEEWLVRDALSVGLPAQSGDFVHARCHGEGSR